MDTETETEADSSSQPALDATVTAPTTSPPTPPLPAAPVLVPADRPRTTSRPNSIALPLHPASTSTSVTTPTPTPTPRFNLPQPPPRDPHHAAQAAALNEQPASTTTTSAAPLADLQHDRTPSPASNTPLPAVHPADHPTHSLSADDPDPTAAPPTSPPASRSGHHSRGHGWTSHRRRSRSARSRSRTSPLSDTDDADVLHGDHIPDRAWLAQHLDLAAGTHDHADAAANDGFGIIVDRVVSAQLLEHHAVVMHQLLHRCRHTDPAVDALYLIRAENRYVKWLFMLERLRAVGDEGLVHAGRIVPPLDVVLMWLAHFTAVRHYVEDVSRLFDDSLLYLSPPLAKIRELLDADPFGYAHASSERMWTSFTGEDWTLQFDDASPFYLSCPTCTNDVEVTPAEYLRLKLEQGYKGLSCGQCGTVLTASFLSAVRFVNDFKGSLREPNTYVAGTLLNPVSGKPNHYLSKQIVQYLSQAPSVADLYAAVVVPVPSPPHSPVLVPQPVPAIASPPPLVEQASTDVATQPLPAASSSASDNAPLAPTPIRPGSAVTVLAPPPRTHSEPPTSPTSPTPRTTTSTSTTTTTTVTMPPGRRSTDSARSAEARRQQQDLEFVYALSHSLVQRGGTMTRNAPSSSRDAAPAALSSVGGVGLGLAMAAAADARQNNNSNSGSGSSSRHHGQHRRPSFSFWTHTSSPKPAKQSLDPWRDIANVLFRLEVDLYALELEDHRLISWHIRAAIDRMERGYRNLVTPLSLDLIARVRGHWRTTAALIVAWLAYAGAKAPVPDQAAATEAGFAAGEGLAPPAGRPGSVHSTSGSDDGGAAAVAASAGSSGLANGEAPETQPDQDASAAINHHPADAVMAMLPVGMLGIPGLSHAPPAFSSSSSAGADSASLASASTFSRKRHTTSSKKPASSSPSSDRLSVLVTPAASSSSYLPPAHAASSTLSRSSPLTRASPPNNSPSATSSRNPRAAQNHPLPAPIALEVAAVAAMANDPPPAMYKLTRSKSATAKLGGSGTAGARARTRSTPGSAAPAPAPAAAAVAAASVPSLHSAGSLDDIVLDPESVNTLARRTAPPVPRLPEYVHPPLPSDASSSAPIPSLLAVVDTHVLSLSTVRYHKFLLLQRAHAGLYSARMALPIDLVLANWTHLLYPPRYIRFSAAHFGRLVTYEFATVQALDAALRNTTRKWRRRYGEHVDVGYRPKLSWGDKIAAVVDRFVGRLVSAAPL